MTSGMSLQTVSVTQQTGISLFQEIARKVCANSLCEYQVGHMVPFGPGWLCAAFHSFFWRKAVCPIGNYGLYRVSYRCFTQQASREIAGSTLSVQLLHCLPPARSYIAISPAAAVTSESIRPAHLIAIRTMCPDRAPG